MSEKPSARLWEAIVRIGAGEAAEEDHELVFARYRPVVRAFYSRVGVPIEDRGDLTQDVFFRVCTGRGTFKSEKKFRSWILTIARNTLRNRERDLRALKRDALEESLTDQPEEGIHAANHAPHVADVGRSALDNLVAQEAVQELMKAIGELPARMRQCMILRVVEGHSYDEIARILRISIETVKAHLHQGRRRLGQLLKDRTSSGSFDLG